MDQNSQLDHINDALHRARQDAAGRVTDGEGEKSLAGKYLTFFLGGEEYGLQILKVREIIGMQEVTRVPQTAPFVLGVINLRGKVIPVIDLRLRFGLPPREADERTCIIVVGVEGASGQEMLISVKVDEVSEVANIQPDEVEETPSFASDLETTYILGMAKTEGRVKILLDIDRVIGDSQLVVA